MCKIFDQNRDRLLYLIYEMKSFTVEEISAVFGDYEGFIGDSLTVKEFLFSLCETDLLNYDGMSFRLVPEDQQINHQLLKCLAYA